MCVSPSEYSSTRYKIINNWLLLSAHERVLVITCHLLFIKFVSVELFTLLSLSLSQLLGQWLTHTIVMILLVLLPLLLSTLPEHMIQLIHLFNNWCLFFYPAVTCNFISLDSFASSRLTGSCDSRYKFIVTARYTFERQFTSLLSLSLSSAFLSHCNLLHQFVSLASFFLFLSLSLTSSVRDLFLTLSPLLQVDLLGAFFSPALVLLLLLRLSLPFFLISLAWFVDPARTN